MMNSIEQIRAQFPGLRREVAYLDNAATTQICQASIDAMVKYWTNGRSNIGRGLYPLAEESMKQYANARCTVAGFVGADVGQCIFTKSVTEGLNTLAFGLSSTVNKGDEILVSPFEHHANLLPWRRLARDRGAIVRTMPMTADFKLDLDETLKMMNDRTRIVATTLVSNVLGTIVPVAKLSERAHQLGAIVIVDAAQAVAHQRVSMKELGADVLVFGAHKMYGPAGIAALVCSDDIIDKMQPMIVGGGMVDEVCDLLETWKKGVEKFEGGSPNVEGAIGFAATCKFVNELIENDEKRGQVRNSVILIGKLYKALSAMDRVNVLSSIDSKSIICFTIEGAHPHDVAELLGSEGVYVRAGNMCAQPLVSKLASNGVIRLSLGIYNDEEDIDKLLTFLPNVIKLLV